MGVPGGDALFEALSLPEIAKGRVREGPGSRPQVRPAPQARVAEPL